MQTAAHPNGRPNESVFVDRFQVGGLIILPVDRDRLCVGEKNLRRLGNLMRDDVQSKRMVASERTGFVQNPLLKFSFVPSRGFEFRFNA